MRRIISGFIAFLLLAGPVSWTETPPSTAPPASSAVQNDDPTQLRQEIDQLKKSLGALEQRLAAQEKQNQAQKDAAAKNDDATVAVADLDKRVSETEKEQALDRLRFSGDYRFEAHSIWGTVPAHWDGMQLQNYMVKSLWLAAPTSMGGQGGPNGLTPEQMAQLLNSLTPAQYSNLLNGMLQQHYADYQYFTSNLNFSQLKGMVTSFPASMQQALMQYLMQIPGANGSPLMYVPSYKDNNKALYTNRLRLKFGAKVSDNVSFEGRLSMYKVFGDSTGVQVFNGQPNTLTMDGTNAGVPNSDILRVERAYFSWNNIGGSKFYFSIGRRPSTSGIPLNYRDDELRGGTPPSTLFDFQYDGMTLGYRINDRMVWRVCYGVGYESGFGQGDILKLPQDRLKDVHLIGAVLDLWDTDKTTIQTTVAHAFNVTDGFNGLIVLPVNPLTGDAVNAPVVMRYTPSSNLGSINLAGVVVTRRTGPVDFYVSGNYSGTRPNGLTGPFGGLMSNPFEIPQDRNGYMVLGGVRYNFGNDERTKLGFEVNHGTQYWFNFAQAQDDIIAPKTNTRGEVYEVYFTHRISQRFIFKADYMKYNYRYSGSGWDVGAPASLDSSTPSILGFPTYKDASMGTLSIIARF